jgi:hypothetical protein
MAPEMFPIALATPYQMPNNSTQTMVMMKSTADANKEVV